MFHKSEQGPARSAVWRTNARDGLRCPRFLKTVAALAVILAAVAFPVYAVDPSMLNLVMPDAKVIAGADVDRVKNSPFGQFLLTQIEQEQEREFQDFLAITGFDPRRDLREVLMASDTADKSSHGLIAARGVFDEAKLTAAATAKGATVSNYQGVKLLLPDGGTGKNHGAVAFLGGGLALAGPVDVVKLAIDRQRAGIKIPADLAARIQAASSSYDAWVVTTTSPMNLSKRMPGSPAGGAMQGNVMQAIDSVMAGVRFGSSVELAGEAVTRTEKDANALVDVVRFLASMAGNNRDAKSPFTQMVESLQLTAEGKNVKFSISAPEDEIEKLVRPKRNLRTKKVVYEK